MKIKAGDKVIINTGKDRGKEGTVLEAFPREGKVVLDGLNMVKKFVKAGSGKQGGIIDVPAKMDVSNVSYIDPKTKKATRVGYQVDAKGNKTRLAKKSGSAIK